METRASYVIVGGFVLTLILGLFLFVIWLTDLQLHRQFAYYRIEFKGSVTGLQVGSPVRYRGIPVGGVTSMKINSDNVEEIEVLIKIAVDTPVNESTVASMELQGITGGVYIQLTGVANAPPLERKEGQRYPVIKSKPSALAELFAQAPELMDRLNILAAHAILLFSDHNLQAIAGALDDLKKFTGAFAAKSDTIAAFADKALDVAQKLDTAGETANTLLTNLTGDERKLANEGVPAMKDLRQSSANFLKATEELNGILTDNRAPIKNFSTQGLFQLTQFFAEGRDLVASLNRLVNRFQADPARFLFGDQQQGIPSR